MWMRGRHPGWDGGRQRARLEVTGCGSSGCFHLAIDEAVASDYLAEQLVVVEAAPALLGGGGEFVDHGQGGGA